MTKTHTSKTLITVKYNCYKNIAFIHNKRKKNDEALEFLLKVSRLDSIAAPNLRKIDDQFIHYYFR